MHYYPEETGELSLRGSIVMERIEVWKDALLPNVEGLTSLFGSDNRTRYGLSCFGLPNSPAQSTMRS